MILSSCSSQDDNIAIKGRFLNLNRGEFYIYSTDGAMEGLDTVTVDGGRFSHVIDCKQSGTLTLLFPNFAEQVIFATPGKDLSVEADASHLKEMEVKGTKENELMTRFRKSTSALAAPDVVAAAEKYIRDNARPAVSIYLLRKYFVQADEPDYDKAAELADILAETPDERGLAARLRREIDFLKTSAVGSRMPQIKAEDINGDSIKSTDLTGKTTVISVMATWNTESVNQQRMIRNLFKNAAGRLNAVSISMDAGMKELRRIVERDSLTWPVICDGEMFQSAIIKQVGLCRVPDNMIIDERGIIVGCGLSTGELKNKVEALLKSENAAGTK